MQTNTKISQTRDNLVVKIFLIDAPSQMMLILDQFISNLNLNLSSSNNNSSSNSHNKNNSSSSSNNNNKYNNNSKSSFNRVEVNCKGNKFNLNNLCNLSYYSITLSLNSRIQ